MIDRITVTCPKCGTKLRLKAMISTGKKIVCPKCQTRFASPGADVNNPSAGVLDDDDSCELSSAPPPRSVRLSHRHGSGAKHGTHSSFSTYRLPALLLLGGSGAVVAIVALVSLLRPSDSQPANISREIAAAPPMAQNGKSNPPVASPESKAASDNVKQIAANEQTASPTEPTSSKVVFTVAGPLSEPIAFSPEGRVLAVRRGNQIVLWSLDTRALVQSFEAPGCQAITFTKDSTTLITAGQRIDYWNIATGTRVASKGMAISQSGVALQKGVSLLAGAFSADGSRFVGVFQIPYSGYYPDRDIPINKLRLFDLLTETEVQRATAINSTFETGLVGNYASYALYEDIPEITGRLKFSHDGHRIVVDGNSGVDRFSQTGIGAKVVVCSSNGRPLYHVAHRNGLNSDSWDISPVRELLAIGQNDPDNKGKYLVKVLNSVTGQSLAGVPLAKRPDCLRFSPDSKVLGVSSQNGKTVNIHFWKVDQQPLQEIGSYNVSVAENASRASFWMAPDAKRTLTWTINDGLEVSEHDFLPGIGPALEKDDDVQSEEPAYLSETTALSTLFSGSKEISEFGRSGSPDVTTSIDGRFAAISDRDLLAAGSELHIWSAESNEIVHQLDGIHASAFSIDGRHLATYTENGPVKLWDTSLWQDPPKELAGVGPRELAVRDEHVSPAEELAFAADGEHLYFRHQYGIDALNISKGKIRNFEMSRLAGMSIAPDGRTMVLTHARGGLSLLMLNTLRIRGVFDEHGYSKGTVTSQMQHAIDATNWSW